MLPIILSKSRIHVHVRPPPSYIHCSMLLLTSCVHGHYKMVACFFCICFFFNIFHACHISNSQCQIITLLQRNYKNHCILMSHWKNHITDTLIVNPLHTWKHIMSIWILRSSYDYNLVVTKLTPLNTPPRSPMGLISFEGLEYRFDLVTLKWPSPFLSKNNSEAQFGIMIIYTKFDQNQMKIVGRVKST